MKTADEMVLWSMYLIRVKVFVDGVAYWFGGVLEMSRRGGGLLVDISGRVTERSA